MHGIHSNDLFHIKFDITDATVLNANSTFSSQRTFNSLTE